MATSMMGIAELDEARLAKFRELEIELGIWIVALGTTLQTAELKDERLKRLQALDEEDSNRLFPMFILGKSS